MGADGWEGVEGRGEGASKGAKGGERVAETSADARGFLRLPELRSTVLEPHLSRRNCKIIKLI